MSLSINTNASAIIAMASNSSSGVSLSSAMERLASGSRINSASDDTAGIAIASRLTANIRGTNQAVRNAMDGQALIDTAEGAHKEVEKILQRMREVSVQSANDTNNQQDRNNLQAEFNALSHEVDRIAATTTWAGQKLISEPPASINLQIGAGTSESDQISISLESMSTFSLGIGTNTGSAPISAQTLLRPMPTNSVGIGTSTGSALISAQNSPPAPGQTIVFGGINTISQINETNESETNSSTKLDFGTSTTIDSSLDIEPKLQNGLILKSSTAGVGTNFAKIDLKEGMSSGLITHLEGLIELTENLEVAGTQSEIDTIKNALSDKKTQISAFVGSYYTGAEIKLISELDSAVRNAPLEIISSVGSSVNNVVEFVSLEVDFLTLFENVSVPARTGTAGQCSCGAFNCDGAHLNANAYGTTTSVGATANSTSSSLDTEINALLMANQWNLSSDGELSYSYYEEIVPYDYIDNPTIDGILELTGTPQGVSQYGATNTAMLDEAFASWDDIIDFEFVKVNEVSGSDRIGDLRVAYTDLKSSAAAFAFGPGSSHVIFGDIFFETENIDISGNDYGYAPDATQSQNFNYFAAIHEIGHAIGLSHPFDASSADGTKLDPSVDNFRKSVMSYVQSDRNLKFYYEDDGSNAHVKIMASSPMLLDVEAVQYLYGREDDPSKSTDTTLAFTPTNSNGMYERIHTVVDAGGLDTFDASAFSRNSNINLSPGTFSSLGNYSVDDQVSDLLARNLGTTTYWDDTIEFFDAQASVANSYYPEVSRTAIFTGEENVGIGVGTLIENAVGGSGNDTITGNDLDNYLTGGQGEDTLDGGAGYDVAIYNGAKSEFTITDLGNGSYTVAHSSSSGANEGTDTLARIEVARFSSGDGTYQYYDFDTQIVAESSSLAISRSDFIAPSYQPDLPTVGGIVAITSGNDARDAMISIDKAIEAVNAQRSRLGALSNSLNHTINNLTNISSNLTVARGGIQDADFALETTKLVKNQILQRASTAMLAQANASKQNVLTLLRG